MNDNLCVGIDLGTTNSVLATITVRPNGDAVSKVIAIPRAIDMYNTVNAEAKLNTARKDTLPSCIYYREENNYRPLVGDFAKIQYALRPHLVAKSIKSQMGRPLAEGLADDIPDKTPAQISSNILKHMLKEVSKIYRRPITNAVITVPANFDSAMCKATLEAAELAGVQIKNEDGSERPVLLSEPNAVIYDLINQIHNGEIHSNILDLSQKKNVMVFDLGGGTLDITMHSIERRENLEEVLKVNEIATNRYTLLGGDDFDDEIAKEMYNRYLKQYQSHPHIVTELKRNKAQIMPTLKKYAEDIKITLSEKGGDDFESDSAWDDDEDDDGNSFRTGGSMGGIGYAYDDSFSKEELEKILSIFMGTELTFESYKNLDGISATKNIIYPILDVLNKAAEKLNVEQLKVDEVIVNGGMSKFYMITDRLTEFFGIRPIIALDPDQSVARGAAVYHHYLNKYDELKDDMRMGIEVTNITEHSENEPTSKPVAYQAPMGIEWGKSILNDSLYLGTKNGAVSMIIPTGSELPFTSNVMTGFQIEPGQNKVTIPIKSRNLDGSYRTISSGNIFFKQKYPSGAFVAFKLHMGTNKVITMNAWTSTELSGSDRLEEGTVEIAPDNNRYGMGIKTRFIPPRGSVLEPKAEINNMIQLCKNLGRPNRASNTHKRLSTLVNTICTAGNKADFKPVILEALNDVPNEEANHRLFIIARKLGDVWDDYEKVKLSRLCMNQLRAELNGIPNYGIRVNTNIQAIFTLGVCAQPNDLKKLEVLCKNHKYLNACLYTYSHAKMNIDWIIREFKKSISGIERQKSTNIQSTVYAVGRALRQDGSTLVSKNTLEGVVKSIIDIIKTSSLSNEELTCSILAIGWICDQRTSKSEIREGILVDAKTTIRHIEEYYSPAVANHCSKPCNIVLKLINGETLEGSEEEFLLTRLELG